MGKAEKRKKIRGAGAPGRFWETPGLDDLAARQGVAGPHRLDDMVGHGAALWASKADFDRFLRGVRRRREEDRQRVRGRA